MKTTRIFTILALMGMLVTATPNLAQAERHRGGRGMKAGSGPGLGKGGIGRTVKRELMQYLYSVHLIKQYATELKLTEPQVEKLQKVVNDVNSEVENLTWDLERESKKLSELVKNVAKKEAVYAQMDRIFKYENKIKKKYIGLLIVVRDILTPAQRTFLDGVRAKHEKRRGRGKGHGKHGFRRPHGGPDAKEPTPMN